MSETGTGFSELSGSSIFVSLDVFHGNITISNSSIVCRKGSGNLEDGLISAARLLFLFGNSFSLSPFYILCFQVSTQYYILVHSSFHNLKLSYTLTGYCRLWDILLCSSLGHLKEGSPLFCYVQPFEHSHRYHPGLYILARRDLHRKVNW